ncbi:MAG: CPBP family intramembrane metalloprotease [Promethearchaeota archaeon]|nr:MAG: CPBP family intramembrane metalloprotease [Candidatus Lokiarchaeota archaeon]
MVKIREKLIKYPLLGSIVLMGLFGLFLFGSTILSIILFGSSSFLMFTIMRFIIIFIALMILFLIITPFGLHLPNGKESFDEWKETIGLSVYKPLKRNILLGLLLFAVTSLCGWIFIIIFGVYIFSPNAIFGSPQSGNLGFLIFITALRPGIWEEVMFRGIILTLLAKKYSEKKSVIISSILFGLMHLFNLLSGGNIIITVIQVIYATFFGIVFGYLFIKTKSLLPCIITHYLIDSLGQLFASASVTNFFSYIMITIFGFGLIPMILNLILIRYLVKSEDSI